MTDRYPHLDLIYSPDDLKQLSITDLKAVADELRQFLIKSVLKSGGHFASGLGVVELTVALHYIFNTPDDAIIWDVGHQAYPHKILTKRKDQIHSIRQKNGLGPFPSIAESEYDAFGVGHSSTSISAALGMAVASHLKGNDNRQLIAVIGDGALTAGQAFEALNHAGDLKANILVILNDNNMSISPNVGALSTMLTRTLSNPILQSVRTESGRLLEKLPFISAIEIAKKTEEHLKSFIADDSTIFEELGFQYFGSIDGHDLPTLINTLENLRHKKGPRLLHIATQKGKGYQAAENSPVNFHAVSATPKKVETQNKTAEKQKNIPTYTQVFSQWLCQFGQIEEDLIAITPAMCEGSGLTQFSQRFPTRYFDTAIAEQHAVTFAAGLAAKGLKPVVAIYSTFLQRAYDQLIHDVAIQKLPVLFAIDRAGIVGPDGATHSGTFDLAFLRIIPNLIIMAPSNEAECHQMLTTGLYCGQPAAVRYPRGKAMGIDYKPDDHQTLPIGKADLIQSGSKLLVISIGSLLPLAQIITDHFNGSLVNLRFVKPLDIELLTQLAKQHAGIITIEDGAIMGGAGSAISEMLNQQNIHTPIHHFGIDDYFPNHGERDEILNDYGLNEKNLIADTTRFLESIN